MSTLLQLKDAQLSFGSDPILDRAEFNIEHGERVCIVGRNGAGKSSLMKVIDQEIQLDGGSLVMSSVCRKTHLRSLLLAFTISLLRGLPKQANCCNVFISLVPS